MLHVTNGESVVQTWRETGLPGEIFSWDDVLHEGPIPADLPLEQLSDIRARFLADEWASSYEDIRAAFVSRDRKLREFPRHEEFCLWFEHDLYDQLQLIQILDLCRQMDQAAAQVSLICINEFPGVATFHGLGQLSANQLRSLWDTREPVGDEHYEAARLAWKAVRSPDPTAVADVLNENLTALPFLRPALRRYLQQFPSMENGLSRTEQFTLEVLAKASLDRAALFRAVNAREEAPFLGDLTFFSYLDNLQAGGLLLNADTYTLTDRGERVLAGELDWLTAHPYDRRFGGAHLRAPEPVWRWAETPGTLLPNRAR